MWALNTNHKEAVAIWGFWGWLETSHVLTGKTGEPSSRKVEGQSHSHNQTRQILKWSRQALPRKRPVLRGTSLGQADPKWSTQTNVKNYKAGIPPHLILAGPLTFSPGFEDVAHIQTQASETARRMCLLPKRKPSSNCCHGVGHEGNPKDGSIPLACLTFGADSPKQSPNCCLPLEYGLPESRKSRNTASELPFAFKIQTSAPTGCGSTLKQEGQTAGFGPCVQNTGATLFGVARFSGPQLTQRKKCSLHGRPGPLRATPTTTGQLGRPAKPSAAYTSFSWRRHQNEIRSFPPKLIVATPEKREHAQPAMESWQIVSSYTSSKMLEIHVLYTFPHALASHTWFRFFGCLHESQSNPGSAKVYPKLGSHVGVSATPLKAIPSDSIKPQILTEFWSRPQKTPVSHNQNPV